MGPIMQVSISSEGSDSLRGFAEAMLNASTGLVDALAELETSFSLVADSLGPQRDDYRAMLDICREPTLAVIEASESMSIDLVDTADIIDEYLSDDSIEDDLETLINAAGQPKAELAYDLQDSARFTKDHSTAASLDQMRKAGTPSKGHRHPVSFGSWLTEDGLPIKPSEVGDSGVFRWYPDPDHVFGGPNVNPTRMSAAEVMNKYSFACITFKDGYPVFPASAIVAEIGLPAPLTTARPSNFSTAEHTMLEEKLLGRTGFFTTEQFRLKVGQFMRERGSTSDWFQTKSDIRSFLSSQKLTWHEKEDMMTMQLIPSEVHSMFVHDGGVSNAGYRDSLAADFEILAKVAFKQLLR